MKKFQVGILGATGMVGQRLVTLLANHPWFEVSVLAASGRSAGKFYKDVVENRWMMREDIPESLHKIILKDAVKDADEIVKSVDFVFSALSLSWDATHFLEEQYACMDCPVISNNSAHRFTHDVPMIIPEINPEHISLIYSQKRRFNVKRGFIVVKSNCSLQSYIPALTPLLGMGLKKVYVATYQAISGAGKTFETWPEMVDNVIPYIKGEEEKSEFEPMKIWGKIKKRVLIEAKKPFISASCVRVPVTDGHTSAVFAEFSKKIDLCDVVDSWNSFVPKVRDLPSSPEKFLRVVDDDLFQLKVQREKDKGMAISIGRLQKITDKSIKFVSMSHNTIRGAAGGAVLLAEWLCNNDYIVPRGLVL